MDIDNIIFKYMHNTILPVNLSFFLVSFRYLCVCLSAPLSPFHCRDSTWSSSQYTKYMLTMGEYSSKSVYFIASTNFLHGNSALVVMPTTFSEMCLVEDVLGTGLQIAGGCLDRSASNLSPWG